MAESESKSFISVKFTTNINELSELVEKAAILTKELKKTLNEINAFKIKVS